MAEIKIKKVKMKGDFITFSYSKGDGKGYEAEVKGDKHKAPVHPDFLHALNCLKIHLAIMTGYISPTQIKDPLTAKPELTEDFRVTGYSWSHSKTGDESAVIITGGRKLPNMNDKFISLNSPRVWFNSDPAADAYKHLTPLEKVLQICDKEGVAYLKGEKRGTEAQQQLDFDGDDDHNDQPVE